MPTSEQKIDCSLKGLLHVSYPVVFSMLSATLMQVLDRVMLSHYSFEAMNGAAVASQVLDTLLLPLLSFASVSEVFVGRLNGAGQYKRTSVPVAQMLLFLLLLVFLVVIPLGIVFQTRLIPQNLHKEGLPYFKLGLLTFPVQILFSSLSAFFVGTRRPFIIMPCVIAANLLNAILDWFLIFGHGPFRAMGAEGAAWASLVASTVSGLGLLFFFVAPSMAAQYNTRKVRFDLSLLKKNIVLGAPHSVSELIEMTVWVAVLWFLEMVNPNELTLHNVAVILWIFFLFLVEGFQKGVMALASNCIGARQENRLRMLIRSMGILTAWGAGLMAIPLLLFPRHVLIWVFEIRDPQMLMDGAQVLRLLWGSLVIVLFHASCFGGILAAGGDTYFLMMVKIASILLCVAAPILMVWRLGHLTAVVVWILSGVQALFNGWCFISRYRSGRWKHLLVG